MNFINLSPVEIMGEAIITLDPATVNVNRITSIRVIGHKYADKFGEDIDGYYATVALAPDTFPARSLLGGSSYAPNNASGRELHWWITKSQYDQLIGGII